MTDNDLDGILRLGYAGDIPALVAEVRRLRGTLERLEAVDRRGREFREPGESIAAREEREGLQGAVLRERIRAQDAEADNARLCAEDARMTGTLELTRATLKEAWAEAERLRGLVKDAEVTGGLSGHSPPYVLGCPWCLSAPTEFGMRHSVRCPAFTPDGQVR